METSPIVLGAVWNKFFIQAGVQEIQASKYTAIFSENRIQPGMLEDLDKQVLKDVGISAVGDIISILRHTKEVLEQGGLKLMENAPAATPIVKERVSKECNNLTTPTPQLDKKEEKKCNLKTTTRPQPLDKTRLPAPPTRKRCCPPSLLSLKLEPPVMPVPYDGIKRRRPKSESDEFLKIFSQSPLKEERAKHNIPVPHVSRPTVRKNKKDSRSRSKTKKSEKMKSHKRKHKPKSKKKSKSRSKSRSPKRKKDEYFRRDEDQFYISTKSKKSSTLHSRASYSRKYSDLRDISDETVTSSSSKPKLPSPLKKSREIDIMPVPIKSVTNKNEEHGITITKPNFVMIYRLSATREWKEQGMGSVTFSQGIIKCVSIENASLVLLESEIKKDTVFENSKETFMSWTNSKASSSPLNAEEAHGLRFKEISDFNSIWSQCKEYLGGCITKYNEEGGPKNGLSFGLASIQGWCSVMEDTHSTWISLPGRLLKNCSLFSIFDGHGGSLTSTFAADNFLECVMDEDARTGNLAGSNQSEIVSILSSAHFQLDRRCRMQHAKEDVEDKSGSTAVSLFVNEDFLFISNLGDSRALLCSEGKVIFATVDHKPGRESELKRIAGAGGSVTAVGKTRRINGDLSVSRGFGDYRYKINSDKGVAEQVVSPEPDITSFPRRVYSSDFVILASDGIWDVISNEDLASFVQNGLDEGLELKGICNRILDMCLNKESQDNMSMIIVKLHEAED